MTCILFIILQDKEERPCKESLPREGNRNTPQKTRNCPLLLICTFTLFNTKLDQFLVFCHLYAIASSPVKHLIEKAKRDTISTSAN